jgi:hypothetical protein
MQKIIFGIILLAIASALIGCNPSTSGGGSNEDSPTGAYKRLYAAVKAKDTEAIKAVMTKKSLDFAKVLSSQQNKPVEQVLENGFTATTFSPTLPQIRDERVKDNMGAVEVFNSKDNRWEDLPFINEDGAWRLAIGEMFANTWTSPGKGQAEKEREAANAASGNTMVPLNVNVNGNFKGVPMPPAMPANTAKPSANANK